MEGELDTLSLPILTELTGYSDVIAQLNTIYHTWSVIFRKYFCLTLSF